MQSFHDHEALSLSLSTRGATPPPRVCVYVGKWGWMCVRARAYMFVPYVHACYCMCVPYLHTCYCMCVPYLHTCYCMCVPYLHTCYCTCVPYLHACYCMCVPYLHACYCMCVPYLHACYCPRTMNLQLSPDTPSSLRVGGYRTPRLACRKPMRGVCV